MEPDRPYRGSMPSSGASRRGGAVRSRRCPAARSASAVYAGIDSVSGKKHHLTEIIPAGPRAAREAEKVRTRLLAQVDEQRNPRTRATVDQLLDRHLKLLSVEPTTLDSYETFIRNHIRPSLRSTRTRRTCWAGGPG